MSRKSAAFSAAMGDFWTKVMLVDRAPVTAVEAVGDVMGEYEYLESSQ